MRSLLLSQPISLAHRAKFAALNEQTARRQDDIRRYVAKHASWAAYNSLLG